ncbi:SDR family NAD(P)-dependent oxidoreductase [Caulobacter sp. 602-1]|uniref:SDR family NAD(P)-dependent oxidoreductase n=1 Tax=Caulobacter sp. 602-1 TaxID=2492472 RepID=UPI001F3DA3AB|nr:SDR family NAD(P)-dependent oxidoreductase [Caulobacter sp. 602-1]
MDLRGRRVLVTGVTSALGAETARALAARGASVVGATRCPGNGVDALFPGRGDIALTRLDLASLASIDRCADRLGREGRAFDLVIAHAAVRTDSYSTAHGVELHMGINHLGHFALVQQITPLLSPGARLVMVSSEAHRLADLDLDDPSFRSTPFDGRTAHARSKTANVLLALEFDRRHRDKGIRAMAANPGPFDKSNGPSTGRTIGQAAATTVWCGVVASAAAIGGRYCETCRVADVVERQDAEYGVRGYAMDGESAERLWAWSQDILGARLQ